MRKNYTQECSVPATRNALIDMINDKKPVIVLKNELITEIHQELNKEKKDAKKSGSTLKKGGVLAGLYALFFSSHPVGWLIGGALALTAGTIKNLNKTLNHYETYKGTDLSGKDIYVLIYKNVDLKLDTISYPTFVLNVNTKKPVKKIKI